MTEQEYQAAVRENHRNLILRHLPKEGEPITRLYGTLVTEMDREELLATINCLGKELWELRNRQLRNR